MPIVERLDAVCGGWGFQPCDDGVSHVAARRGSYSHGLELEAAPGLNYKMARKTAEIAKI